MRICNLCRVWARRKSFRYQCLDARIPHSVKAIHPNCATQALHWTLPCCLHCGAESVDCELKSKPRGHKGEQGYEIMSEAVSRHIWDIPFGIVSDALSSGTSEWPTCASCCSLIAPLSTSVQLCRVEISYCWFATETYGASECVEFSSYHQIVPATPVFWSWNLQIGSEEIRFT